MADNLEDEQTRVDFMLEMAWGVIANVSEGNWERQPALWVEAAERWRDRYHELLAERGQMGTDNNMHPAIKSALVHFQYAHLPAHLQRVSQPFADLAHLMVHTIPQDPQITIGLHKLLEAKDCFVRAAVVAAQAERDAVTEPAAKANLPIQDRWRPINAEGEISSDPAPEHPEEHDEGETGPPELRL